MSCSPSMGELSTNTLVLKDDLSVGVYVYRASPNPERVAMLRFEGREQAETRSVEEAEKCAWGSSTKARRSDARPCLAGSSAHVSDTADHAK